MLHLQPDNPFDPCHRRAADKADKDDKDAPCGTDSSGGTSTIPECPRDNLFDPLPQPTAISSFHRTVVKDSKVYRYEQQLALIEIGSYFSNLRISNLECITHPPNTLTDSVKQEWSVDEVVLTTYGSESGRDRLYESALHGLAHPLQFPLPQPTIVNRTPSTIANAAYSDAPKRKRDHKTKKSRNGYGGNGNDGGLNGHEFPDPFYWFNPEKYVMYKYCCSRGKRHNDFFQRVIEYHWKAGHFHDEFGSEEAAIAAYWRALDVRPGKYEPQSEDYRALWYKMQLTALWSVPQLPYLPKCPEYGEHPVYLTRMQFYRYPNLPTKFAQPEGSTNLTKSIHATPLTTSSVNHETESPNISSQSLEPPSGPAERDLRVSGQALKVPELQQLAATVEAQGKQLCASNAALSQLEKDNDVLQARVSYLEGLQPPFPFDDGDANFQLGAPGRLYSENNDDAASAIFSAATLVDTNVLPNPKRTRLEEPSDSLFPFSSEIEAQANLGSYGYSY